MFSAEAILLLKVLIQCHNAVTMSSFGRQFVVAVPKMFSRLADHTPRITFYLSAANAQSEVHFTTPWLSRGTPLDRVLLIVPQREAFLTVDHEYNSQTNVGPKWTFRLMGTSPFTVTVALLAEPHVSATFLAVPVDSWDIQYYVATLEGNPSVQIMSSQNQNEIEVRLRVNTKHFKFEFLGVNYTDGDKLVFLLEQWKAFAISNCLEPDTPTNGSLSGTFISSRYSVGVVSGNCLASAPPRSCGTRNGTARGLRGDLAAEMMLPKSSYGTEFVLLSPGGRLQGYYHILAAFNRTKMYISTDHRGGTKGSVIHAGNHTVIAAHGNAKIKSNRPMMVVFVYSSPCPDPLEPSRGFSDVKGGPGLCLIIPKHLYYWAYYWTQSNDTSASSEAVIVAKKVDTEYLRLDGSTLQGVNWSAIMGEPDWTTGYVDTSDSGHVAVVSNILSNFACYAFTRAVHTSALSPAAFQGCEETTGVMGDLVDNDCDGRADEELLDGVDNDNDTKVDEDLARLEAAATTSSRENFANNTKCKGDECQTICPYCTDECEITTRACDSCTAGFKNPESGCFRECDIYEYGENCVKSCFVNCGRNCLNKKTGECPKDYMKYTLLLLLILPLGLVVWAMEKRPQEEDSSLIASVKSFSIVNLFDETVKGRDEVEREVMQLMTISDHKRDK